MPLVSASAALAMAGYVAVTYVVAAYVIGLSVGLVLASRTPMCFLQGELQSRLATRVLLATGAGTLAPWAGLLVAAHPAAVYDHLVHDAPLCAGWLVAYVLTALDVDAGVVRRVRFLECGLWQLALTTDLDVIV